MTFPLSSDPNDILGPAGYGEQNWTAGVNRPALPYTIRFENQPTATAPAQQVVITQRLDPDLDWRSFRVLGFGFGSTAVDLPGDRGQAVQRLDLRGSLGVLIDAAASIDLATGTVTFTLTAIDPATGQRPVDPTIGLLPPNDDTGRGDGFFRYSIRAKAAVASGAVIDAWATVVFDENAPIDTPPIRNTLDTTAPASGVSPIDANGGATFVVEWAGMDDAAGSGVAAYDIYVATDGGDYVKWLDHTTAASATFAGEAGQKYEFYSVAIDVAGNEEAAVSADAVVTGGSNAAPTVPLGGSGEPADVGQAVRFAGLAVDPDFGDTLSTRVNYGDGSDWQAVTLAGDDAFDLSHVYTAAGNYTVRVEVTDAKGEVAADAVDVVVRPAGPTVR